jgi:uncharacterized repeat protein (TIGR01451 family)
MPKLSLRRFAPFKAILTLFAFVAAFIGVAALPAAAGGTGGGGTYCYPASLLINQTPAPDAPIAPGDTLSVTFSADTPLTAVLFSIDGHFVSPTLTPTTGTHQYNTIISAVVPSNASVPVFAEVFVESVGTTSFATTGSGGGGYQKKLCDSKKWKGTVPPPPSVDVQIVKTASVTSATVGDDVTYTLTVTNNGPGTATSVVADDVVPTTAPVQSVTAPSGVTCTQTAATGGTDVNCTVGTMTSGASVAISIVVTTTASGNLCNTGTVTEHETDTNPSNNTSTVCIPVNPPPPPPSKGYLEICKAASGTGVTGNFQFKVEGKTYTVPVGACSAVIQVTAGNVTVTEVARAGSQLVSVTTSPAARLVSVSLATRSAVVKVVKGNVSTQTIVTFTNKNVPGKGQLKVCAAAGSGIATGTNIMFQVGSQMVMVPAGPTPGGYCVVVGTFALGSQVTITETIPAGAHVTAITAAPAARLVSKNLATGTAVVTIGSGVTDVTFTTAV